jgi:hypothetical protein
VLSRAFDQELLEPIEDGAQLDEVAERRQIRRLGM